MFTNASQETRAHAKINVYGPPGAGKTFSILSAAAVNHNGRIAVIDTEDGTLFYGKTFDFVRLRASEPNKVLSGLDYLRKNADKIDILIIDSGSAIFARVVDSYTRLEGTTPTTNWTAVNKFMKNFFIGLKALPFHVIMIDHETNEYAENTGNNLKVIGVRPDNYKKSRYDWDFILRFEGEPRCFHVEKSRDGVLKDKAKISGKDIIPKIAEVFEVFVGGEELPAIATATPILSFFSVPENVLAFVNMYKERKLDAAKIASIMGVSKFREFEGTRDEAQALVDTYLESISTPVEEEV